MNLLGILTLGLAGKSREPLKVHCQACNIELTNQGGDVTSRGRVYCHGHPMAGDVCSNAEMFLPGAEEVPVFMNHYRTPKELQKDIRKGRLKEYSPIYRPL